MNTRQAKKLVRQWLEERGLPYDKLTAKDVSFSDLARASEVFVRIHGWEPNPAWTELKNLARENGFYVEAA